MSNIVYVGTSLDGYIADRKGGLDWLESIPNPESSDLGWVDFLEGIDAIVMGRNTFETVLGFGGEWPYPKKVFVLSSTLRTLPEGAPENVALINASPAEVVKHLQAKGYRNLYIDGGLTIRRFLAEDLIDEIIISRLPILLGGGIPLFGDLPGHLMFKHIETKILLDEIVSSRYSRRREATE